MHYFRKLLYSASLLGSSSKENHGYDSASIKSDEGNASFVSDSTALGDIDIEPMHEKHKIWLPISTKGLDAYSVHTEKTVILQGIPVCKCHIIPIHILQELHILLSNGISQSMKPIPKFLTGLQPKLLLLV